MNTIALDRNQNMLLEEIRILIPQFNEMEVADVLKSAISQIKKCKRIKESTGNEDITLSPKIQSLIGIIPPFSEEEIAKDERLKRILYH